MAGLLPIMWSHGTGAEVMQRIAVPMIGGMVLFVLAHACSDPGDLCCRQRHCPQKAQRAGALADWRG